jgi:predicted ATPase
VYHLVVIRRLYVNGFRCLENFELPITGQSSTLLIGKNGSGKTTVGLALQILQRIARGTNRVGDLVRPKDMTRGRTDVPVRFTVDLDLDAKTYVYDLAFEFPKGFKELRVLDEKLEVDGNTVYSRAVAQVDLKMQHAAALSRLNQQSTFPVDWHVVALPIIQQRLPNDPVFVFKQWLSRMLVLRPIPSIILGDSSEETLEPNLELTNFAAWFAGVLSYAPSAYAEVDKYLKQVMPDLRDVKNPLVGKDTRSLIVQFSTQDRSFSVPFDDLSDGEKCFMICALVLAASHVYPPVFCFWDEPDNYLAPSEVGHFILALRKAFQSGGQFIATSHNTEAIRRFSDENTLVLFRNSHLEPTLVRRLSEIDHSGDLVSSLTRGDLEP